MALFVDVSEEDGETIAINFDKIELIRKYGSDNKAILWFSEESKGENPSIKTDMPYLDLVRLVQRKQCKVDVMEPLLCHTVKFDSDGEPID